MAETLSSTTCKVAVLSGGISGERDVSLASGKSVSEALEKTGYTVTVLDPAEKNDLLKLITDPFDVAFLVTHGKGGEDGTLQGFLETIRLPYTGSGVCASALAMNKSRAKQVYREAGLPTLPSITIRKDEDYSLDDIVSRLGDHCVVKVAVEGSSIGLYIEKGREGIEHAIEKAFSQGEELLIEKFCAGRELTVGVIGNDDPKALPIIEIVPRNEFYDFDAKYSPGGSTHICPAEINESIAKDIQKCAEDAHKALGCRGESRTDFILEENGSFWMLETNTLPGMTATSLLPDAASKAGMTYEELCVKLIDLALEKRD